MAQFPAQVWDGLSGNPDRTDVHKNLACDSRDWDTIRDEVIATQTELAAVRALTGAGDGEGAAAGTGVTAAESGTSVNKTVITIADLEVAMTDADAAGNHGTQKIYDFPAGNVIILGATTDIAIVSDDTGIDADAVVIASLGSAAVGVGDATLTSTEANIVPSTSATLTDSAGAFDAQSTAVAVLDGTASPAAIHLNIVAAADDADDDGVITVNGTVTVLWVNLGDN